MTHVVSRTALLAAGIPNIEEKVDTYVRDLKNWLDHHRRVDKEKDTPMPEEPHRQNYKSDEEFSEAFNTFVKAMENRHQAYPMEVIHPELMKCVTVSQDPNGVDHVATDYEINEDLPTEEDTLRSKKNALIGEASLREAKEAEPLYPPGKMRARQLRYQKLLAADNSRAQKLTDAFNALPEHKTAVEAKSKIDPAKVDPALVKQIKDANDSLQKARVKLADDLAHPERDRTAEDNHFLSEYKELEDKRAVISERYAAILSDIEDLTSANIDNWKFPEA